MKARGHAAAWNQEPTEETFRRIAHEFYEETYQIIKARGVKSDGGLAAVFKEMDNKWEAFCRRTDPPLPSITYRKIMRALHKEAAEFVWGPEPEVKE
jgi:hypothetical protein